MTVLSLHGSSHSFAVRDDCAIAGESCSLVVSAQPGLVAAPPDEPVPGDAGQGGCASSRPVSGTIVPCLTAHAVLRAHRAT